LGKSPVGRKVKGVIHWLSARMRWAAEIRLYDRLFTVAEPDADKDTDFRQLPQRHLSYPDAGLGRARR